MLPYKSYAPQKICSPCFPSHLFPPANHILVMLDVNFHLKVLDVILAIYSYITNHSKIQRLKTITILPYLTIL